MDKNFGKYKPEPTETEKIPRDSRPTKLIIEKEEVPAQNSLTGRQSSARLLGIARNQEKRGFSYYRLSDLSRTTSLEVLMRTDQGELRHIELPKRMLENIARFVREDSKPREEIFDCAAFAHFVNDIPYKDGEFEPTDWEMSPLENEDQLMPGDTIFIADKEGDDVNQINEVKHIAIFLGDGLYLSKLGITGKLGVATLEEMKKGFGGNQTYKSVPNPERVRTNPTQHRMLG